ncbi:hypothetical protein B0H19DRAFT_1123643 [Mycena capillaripes]|nr:hypothetical protein B0H19DRAFT_1123643 [Mycena capillaripes]
MFLHLIICCVSILSMTAPDRSWFNVALQWKRIAIRSCSSSTPFLPRSPLFILFPYVVQPPYSASFPHANL